MGSQDIRKHATPQLVINRRELLRRAIGAGLALPAISALLAACDDVDAVDGPDAAVSGDVISLTGSGATFPDPIYQLWVDRYRQVAPNVRINYQSVGSGQGKRDFINNVTDFGSTDAALTDEEMARVPDALHVPTVIGAVGVTYNMPEIPNLRLSGENLARIYLGDIIRWDDPRVQEDNPDVVMPHQDIGVIFRSDGSGTTSIFTDYLSKVSDEWRSEVGSATSVRWPAGIGGEKNPGVMAAVQQVPGGIGYVELIYALVTGMPTVAVQNRQGHFVLPTLDAVQAAAAGFLDDLPADLRVSITDPPEGGDSYPISGFTWMLLRRNQTDRARTAALVDFIYWALTEGDDLALQLHYSPLPDEVREMAIGMLEEIVVDGESVFSRPANDS
jgi:phosphate transport system substrate-binding protein